MKEPPMTCPTIDKFIKELEREANKIEDAGKSISGSIVDALEACRTANEQIREWGDWWKSKAGELEDELCTALNKIEELENEKQAA